MARGQSIEQGVPIDVRSDQEPVILIQVQDEPFPRTVFLADGGLQTGDGTAAPTPHSPQSGNVVLSAEAETDLSGHRLVVLDSGRFVYADNQNPAHLNRSIWLTLSAAAAGTTTEALGIGEATEPSWSWTPGAPLFLGLDGHLVSTPPSAPALFSIQVATAISSRMILFDLKSPISLV